MIWFSSDFHLAHKNIINYCNRPFKKVEEMDYKIFINMSKCLNSGDTLYFLGDLTFEEYVAEDFFKNFRHITIHFITGNHDPVNVIAIASEYCASVSEIKDINIEDQNITLCHYAMRVWNKSHLNAWQLFGHTHGSLQPIGKQYDVSVDNNNFLPVSFEKIKDFMKNQPNNPNYIPPEKRNRTL